MVTLILLLVVAAGIFKGRMDALADEEMKTIDWHRKYDFTREHRCHWWYLGIINPRFPEKFPFSSTLLVFLTDRWHMNQFFMQRCLFLAIGLLITPKIILSIFVAFVLFPIIMGVPFESVYTWYRKQLKAKNNVRY
jgi:hypothetical protein